MKSNEQKLRKVESDIEKLKSKITEHQARLRELEHQKTELENAEIIEIFRKEKLTKVELSAFVRQKSAHAPLDASLPARQSDQQEDNENEE